MFTGLVEIVGRIERSDPTDAGRRFLVDVGGWQIRPEVGESISVDGCCLTLAAEPGENHGFWAFDVIPETLRRTTLGALHPGSRVNLERSATPQTLLGGHVVQGHVDGVGTVSRVEKGSEWRVRIAPPAGLMVYLTPKGSITVQGVSLTVAGVEPGDSTGSGGWFEVALIPTTLEKTTLGDLQEGDRVNLESDVLARTVVHYLRHYAPGGSVGGSAGGVG